MGTASSAPLKVLAEGKMRIKPFLKTIEGMAPNTLVAYEQSLWQLHATIDEDEPTTDEIYAFLKQYPASSLHRHKAAIKAYLEFTHPGEAWPFTRRQFAGSQQKIPRYVSASVVAEIIGAAENEDDRMYVKTLFTLGCRIHELMAIDVGEITPMGVRVKTKGGATRLKQVTQGFYQVLSEYAKGKKGKLFPRPYNYYYIKLKELAIKVGHPEVTPHMLRHARAVDLLKKGMAPAFVQQFLGHASFQTTAIYLQITGGELAQVLEEVESNGVKVS